MKHESVFSAFEGILGCTTLISLNIPLLDDTPVWQTYRCIPPSEYEAVKPHIHQLLEIQVINKRSSHYASPILLLKKAAYGYVLTIASSIRRLERMHSPIPTSNNPWMCCLETGSFPQWIWQMDKSRVVLYMNDIIVFASSIEEPGQMDVVMSHLGQEGLKDKIGEMEDLPKRGVVLGPPYLLRGDVNRSHKVSAVVDW